MAVNTTETGAVEPAGSVTMDNIGVVTVDDKGARSDNFSSVEGAKRGVIENVTLACRPMEGVVGASAIMLTTPTVVG
jgi:hypothetical protein